MLDMFPLLEVEPGTVTLQEYIDNIERIMATSATLVPFIWKHFALTKIPPIYLVAWLRTTYPHRDQIPMWHEFRDRVYVALTLRGEDPERLLRGVLA